ncbi:MAG: hypothetical protein AAF431_11340 [Pseudomonadota bacterium]
MSNRIKIILSIAGLALAVLAQFNTVDKAGLQHTEEGLNRALVTYGISRGLNGVISVVQGTEVAIEPVGVGMTFTPGQILDPVNDLIERFSTVVLVSGTAFGIQRVFLEITSAPLFSITVSLLVILALGLAWFGGKVSPQVKQAVFKAAIVFLIVRFSIPVMAIVGESFYKYFLEPQFQESSQQLLSTTEQLQDIQADVESDADISGSKAGEEKSFLDSARELYRSATNSLNLDQHLEDFKAAAENISEHAIKLIVVFVFQTIIVPLGSLWLILKAIKFVVMRRSPAQSIVVQK